MAYVASFSNVVVARKLEWEQKIKIHSSFLLSSQLSRVTRAKTLATKAKREMEANSTIGGFHAISGDTNNNGEMTKCWWTNKAS